MQFSCPEHGIPSVWNQGNRRPRSGGPAPKGVSQLPSPGRSSKRVRRHAVTYPWSVRLAVDRLDSASYQIVIERSSYNERLSPHRALLGAWNGGD